MNKQEQAPISVRRLWPPWRYVAIDHKLREHPVYGPLVGVAITNGRVIWGRENAERFARQMAVKYHDGRWKRENYE